MNPAGGWSCPRCAALVGKRIFAREGGSHFFWPGHVVARDRHGQICVKWEEGERVAFLTAEPPPWAYASLVGRSGEEEIDEEDFDDDEEMMVLDAVVAVDAVELPVVEVAPPPVFEAVVAPKMTKWSCPKCTLINAANAKKCKICRAKNPQLKGLPPKPEKPPAPPRPN